MSQEDKEKARENRINEKKIRRAVWNAVDDFKMIEAGDKIMVCLSGGKDSYAMLDVLMHMQQAKPFDFEIVAVNLDQKQPGFPEHILPEYLTKVGVPFKIIEEDTYSIVMDKLEEGKTMCSLCSRLRRGNLYRVAKEMGCNKLALGHHRDDLIETMFLNMFFAGKLEAMPAKYRTDDGAHVVIRPLAYCKESAIESYAEYKQYPIIPCNLCGSQDGLQRQVIKKMLRTWDEKYPNRSEIIFRAMHKVSPSHLMDHDLFDFEKLEGKIKAGKIKAEILP